jgi:hypothetical protein
MSFDYDSDDIPDDNVVRGVAAEMADSALKPLTDVEVAEREVWLAEHRARQEQENIAAEQHRLERDRQEADVAQREKAFAQAREREIAQHKRESEIRRLAQSKTLMHLQTHAAGQERRQRELDSALRLNASQQATTTLMAELERAITEIQPKPQSGFAALYRENQRSGWYYTDEE